VDFPIGKLSDARLVTFLTLIATLVASGVLIFHIHLYSTKFKLAIFDKIVKLKNAQKVLVFLSDFVVAEHLLILRVQKKYLNLFFLLTRSLPITFQFSPSIYRRKLFLIYIAMRRKMAREEMMRNERFQVTDFDMLL
jgi:hypothetical protein